MLECVVSELHLVLVSITLEIQIYEKHRHKESKIVASCVRARSDFENGFLLGSSCSLFGLLALLLLQRG